MSLCLCLQDLSQDELVSLTKRTQDGGTEVVQAKAGKVRKKGFKGVSPQRRGLSSCIRAQPDLSRDHFHDSFREA